GSGGSGPAQRYDLLGGLDEPQELLGAPAELFAAVGVARRSCLPDHAEELTDAFGGLGDVQGQEIVDLVQYLQTRPPEALAVLEVVAVQPLAELRLHLAEELQRGGRLCFRDGGKRRRDQPQDNGALRLQLR